MFGWKWSRSLCQWPSSPWSALTASKTASALIWESQINSEAVLEATAACAMVQVCAPGEASSDALDPPEKTKFCDKRIHECCFFFSFMILMYWLATTYSVQLPSFKILFAACTPHPKVARHTRLVISHSEDLSQVTAECVLPLFGTGNLSFHYGWVWSSRAFMLTA